MANQDQKTVQDQKSTSQDNPAPYRDVSDLQDAAKEAAANPERDENGIAQVDTSAAAELQAEQSHRASGAGEGGGPFPVEILQANYLTATPLHRSTSDAYTSHEDAK